MTKIHSFALLAATMALGGCATTSGPTTATTTVTATAALRSADGAAKGSAALVPIDGGFELRIAAEGLPPGVHGAHLHTKGSCDAPDFASAGPHLNPHAKMHGADNPQGSHLGDLPNLTAGADGKGAVTVALQGSQAELEAALFDSDGTAVVIHATADDYRTDPSGNSGGRIACGVLSRG